MTAVLILNFQSEEKRGGEQSESLFVSAASLCSRTPFPFLFLFLHFTLHSSLCYTFYCLSVQQFSQHISSDSAARHQTRFTTNLLIQQLSFLFSTYSVESLILFYLNRFSSTFWVFKSTSRSSWRATSPTEQLHLQNLWHSTRNWKWFASFSLLEASIFMGRNGHICVPLLLLHFLLFILQFLFLRWLDCLFYFASVSHQCRFWWLFCSWYRISKRKDVLLSPPNF